jgi:uncharacterized protein YndB with AHSA1/START domain
MTQHKDLKRRVRARMRKTGEAYTTARAQIIRKPKPRAETRPSTPPASATPAPTPARAALSKPSPREYATIAGMSDETLKENTGCTWERWVRALDHYHADEMSHAEIAKLIKAKYRKTPSWWTQMVAVGYERIKGLRVRGQQRDGTFQATKSRTFDVPVRRLFDAWADDAARRSWLAGVTATVRTATAPKSMRLGLDDGSIVAVGFTAKGRGRSVVAVEHTKLADRDAAERVKGEWAARFDKLAEVLMVRDG